MRGTPTAVAVALAAAAVACGPASPAQIGEGADADDDGALTACVATTPRLVEADGEDGWQGYDIEALEAVAEQLELELRIEEVAFDELVSGTAVNDDECDIGAGGIVAAGDLTTIVDVTAPYREVDRLVVAPEDGAPPPVTEARVGIEDGGPASDALDQLEAGEVVTSPSRGDLVRQLDAGDVDAVLVPGVEVPDVEEVVGPVAILERVPTGDTTVMVLPRGSDEALTEIVDEALRDFAEGDAGATAAERWLDG